MPESTASTLETVKNVAELVLAFVITPIAFAWRKVAAIETRTAKIEARLEAIEDNQRLLMRHLGYCGEEYQGKDRRKHAT